MRIGIFLFLILSICSNANALVIGGSNLGVMGYSEFNEITPSQPYSYDEYNFNMYQNDTEMYVNQAKEYVENCNRDIERIKEKQQDAINKANQAIDDFNNWARRGY